jgi:SAM-dependent methyltransferase
LATEYGADFFETIREGCKLSADAVIPRFLQMFLADERPQTVVDVGCGEGHWGRTFEDEGCEVLGLDGYTDAVIDCIPVDLGIPLPDIGRTFDLAVCLEVAEHLPPERADSFIAELCHLAPVVLFSAAIPGQGGHGHLNEQWPGYWEEKFKAAGLLVTGDFRWSIWNDDRVEIWYRQNLLIAVRDRPESLKRFNFHGPVLPVVHPVLYDARRS